MKKLFKYLVVLFAILSTITVTSCKKDDPEPTTTIPEKFVGTWAGEIDKSYNLYKLTLEITAKGNFSWVEINKNGYTSTGTGTCKTAYNGDDLILDYIPNIGTNKTGRIIGGNLWIDEYCFTRLGGESSDIDPNSVEGKLIGKWSGSDGDDNFYIEFGKDDRYVDYLVVNGQKKYESIGTYSVSNNSLTITSNTNLSNCWGAGYSITFSNNNKTLTLQNDLMNDYGQKLVLSRQ